MGLFKRKKEVQEGQKGQGGEQGLKVLQPLPEIQKLPEIPEIKLTEIKLPEIKLPEKLEKPAEKVIEKVEKEEKTKESLLEVKPALPEIKSTLTPALTIEEKERPEIKGPIFIRIAKYKVVLDAIEKISKQIQQLEADVARLQEIRNREDTEMKKVSEELAELKKKISTIESSLFSKLE
ncbi:MAG: hypothetical protein QXE64_00460 [Candidatus Pacearchaeota archaeon]